MRSKKCFKFTGEERFFRGHFPGAPILPGVVQLELAHKAAEEMLGMPLVLKAVKRMKFVNVIEPTDEVTLELDGEREVNYRFLKGDKVCSQGVLLY